ncbi:hypothetical protein ACIQYS_14490 [Psychrobacillus sp. NPDC096426]|uniref:hypothetical protein n=1 Tax=Psychrobacillus sp. NPDC096426 TaxID=3364491 RepID=UPI0037F81EC7
MNNKSVITLLLISIIGFLVALYALLMQVFGIQSDDKATIIGGILSMAGGALGAFGAYQVAVWQTNKAIENDREIRIRQKKVEKLEELKTAFVSCYITLEEVYKKVYKQQEMINTLIEKKYNVFKKDNFLTNDLENEFIKGVMQLQSFKMIFMNNKEYVPARIDPLEVMTAMYRMTSTLDELLNIHKLLIENNPMNIEQFYEHWTRVTLDFQDAKIAMQKYIFDPKKHIDNEIQENL